MKKHIIFIGFTLLFGIFWLSSCQNDSRYSNIPRAYGKVDNILLVCDSFIWQSAVGDTFRNYFEALYPVTPQPEPLYDVRHLNFGEFTEVKRTHRTVLIMANLAAKDDDATKLVAQALGEKNIQRAATDPTYRTAIHRDRWAQGQIVIYWFAPDLNQLALSFASHSETVIKEIQKHDNETLNKEIYQKGQNDSIVALLKNKYKLNLAVPKDYFVAKADSDAVWLRYETDKTSDNLLIQTLPAEVKLSPDNLKMLRDSLTRKYISSRVEGSYALIDDRYLPTIYQNLLINKLPALQARGIWAMVEDFKGGSFVTYLVPDPARNRVLLIDGFTYAPGQKKRVEMRQLDMIINSLQL